MNPTATILVGSKPCGGWRAGAGCLIERSTTPGEQLSVNVRGSAYGEAFLSGADQMDAVWFSAKLVGTIPEVGRVLFTTRPDAESHVTISPTGGGAIKSMLRRGLFRAQETLTRMGVTEALSAGFLGHMTENVVGRLFFPAFAAQDMFYEIQVLDAAGVETRRLHSTPPMRFEAEIAAIPPLKTTFRTALDVDFVDVRDGTPVFRMLAGAPGFVDDKPGLEVELVSHSIDHAAGKFDGHVVIRASGDAPTHICWFVTSVMSVLTSSAQAVDVAFTPPLEIPITASFSGSLDQSGIVIQCFSADETEMESHLVIPFRTL